MFRKVLIANRGEAALRILRACHDLEIRTVAIHSTADADACMSAGRRIGVHRPADVQSSYLNVPAIITAAHVSGVDALHPGYGFLSENADFAQIVALHDITFIGPKAEHISVMGTRWRPVAACAPSGCRWSRAPRAHCPPWRNFEPLAPRSGSP